MKKISFFIESLAGGGAEKVLCDLVANLDKTKFDVTVIPVINTGVYKKRITAACKVRPLLDELPSLASRLSRLWYGLKYKAIYRLPPSWIYRWFVREKYDVEVAFVEGFATKLVGTSSNPASKKIAWVHTDLANNHWTQMIFKSLRQETKTYQRFAHIACVSEEVKNSVAKLFGITKNVSVLYNPVNSEAIRAKADEPITEQPRKTGTPRLVSAGRLAEQKGYDRLLRIHKRLLGDGLVHELWILGEGSQRGRLEAYLRENNLANSVHLWGFQANPYAYLRQCDLFVCPSRAEGFSTAVTEALIIGLPVVTTECSGMKELLGANNEYGMVTKNSEEALFEGIKTVLQSPEKLDHYRKQAEARGHDFGLARTIPRMECFLAETVAS